MATRYPNYEESTLDDDREYDNYTSNSDSSLDEAEFSDSSLDEAEYSDSLNAENCFTQTLNSDQSLVLEESVI